MDAIGWLLDEAADPAIRWQALRDLTDATESEIAAERSRVAREGWGAELLAAQDADGHWDGGTYRPGWADERRPFFDAWTATHFTLQQLTDFGVDPVAPEVREAVGRVRANVRWEHDGEPYFDGEVEPCINGVALASAAYFGEDGARIAHTLVASRLDDGAWNCWAEDGARVSSFHSTVCAAEGLAAWQRSAHAGPTPDPAVADALATGEEYLLERGLFRRRSTAAVADPRMTMLSYPVYWYHDVLRGLEHFRRADRRDPRLADAVELVRGAADERGLWSLANRHEGPCWSDFGEAEGRPSRWVTLRALRVLRWWDRG